MRITSLLTGIILFLSHSESFSQVNMTTSGSHSQDFSTLINTGSSTWSDNSTISNWYSQRSGTGTGIIADPGSGTAGSLYSYGTGTNSDRALGTIGSGGATAGNFAHGVLLRNTSGNIITDIKVSYTLEQWRNSAAVAQSITFYYKISSSTITNLNPNVNSGWIQVTGLTLNSPITGGTAGALDGNNVSNRISASNVSIPSLTLNNNEYIMLKWEDPDHSGTDHGLAIDDVSITWTISSSPSIVHTGTSPSSANLLQSSTNNLLYAIKVDVATTAAALTQIAAASGGTWINGDLSNFKLWYSSDAVWDGSDVLLKTILSPTTGTQTFSSISQSIPVGTKYLLITCDISSSATLNNTVSASCNADANLTYSNSPSFSGSSFAAANLMTIIGPEIQLQFPTNTDVACGFTLPFGSVLVNQTSSLTFTIKNSGTSNLNITTLPLSITGTNANQFSITTQATSPIPAGGTVDVIVQFAPTSGGSKTANISIPNNDGSENPCNITLSGTGTPPGITHTGTSPTSTTIAQSSTSNILYQIKVDVTTLATTLTQVVAATSGSWLNGDLSNFNLWYSSDATLDVGDILVKTITNPITGTQTFGSLNQSISIGTQYLFITCDVSAGATIGRTVSAGCTANANLTYNFNPSFSGSMFGTANLMTIIGPEIQVQYPGTTNVACGFTLPFGNLLVNQTSSLTFKINNSGTADLNITNLPLSLSGTDADQFIITTQASSPITSGGTSDVIVQFAPTSPGAKTASISIANNDGTENPCAVNITGTGTSSPVITHTGTTPASINIAQNSTNNVLYKIQLDIATSATTLTQVLATTSGSWINGDISNFKLWYSTDANFGSDAVLSTVSNPSPGDISFATLSQAIPTGTKYLFITCDVASGAIINNTVSAFVDLDSDLSYNNTPSFSNSSFTAANLMIIIGTPELQLEYPINTNIACGGTVAFGNINVNQSSSLTFRIRNSGTGNLNLTTLPLVLGGSNAAMFTITTQPTSPISAGSFSDVVVQFLPTSTGAKTANISIANNDSDENPCSVNLTGTGVLVNDNCTGAVSLSVSSTPTCGGSTSGTTVGATSSGVSAILCNGFTGTADDDVWYSFVASSTSHIITVVGASPLDVIIDLRSGACNGTALSCADATASGGTEALIATGLTIGATYYVRVYGYDSGSGYGTFTICVTTPAPPSYFRTKQSGLWSAASTWEYSTDNMTWNDAGTAPLPTDLNIDIRSPHAIVIDVATSIDQTTVEVGSTLEISGPLTIQDGTGNDLIVMGILKNSSGTFNTTGTISIENGGKYQHNPTSSFGTIPTITWQTGSTCEIIRGNADPGTSITQNYYNFTWNSSNQSGAINLTGRLKTVNGDLTIQNTGANILRVTGSSANTLDVAGNLIIGDATKFDLGNGSASSIINVTGNLNINGTGSLDLMGGGPNNGQINLKGNLNSSASSNITENTSGTTSKIAFIGTSQQTASFGTVNNRINIEINGSPGVSLSSGLTLTSSADLKLSSGLLSLNNFDLNMGSSNTTITGGSFSSYIKTNGTGTLQRTVGGSNVTFPIGNSNYNPLVLLNTGTSDIYSARVADAVLTDGLTGIEYAQKVVDRSWIITENNSGASNVTATFQWSATDELSGFNRSLCVTGHYTSNAWQTGPVGSASGSGPFTRQRTGITSFSPFGILGEDLLPIELISFNAKFNKSKVDLSWTTASEKDNDRFEIQRSYDADRFDFLGTVKGAGTSFLSNNYNFTDYSPTPGINYYRIKQIDTNGEFSFSPVRSVEMTSNHTVNIFPTVAHSEFRIDFSEPLVSDAIIDIIAVGSGKIVCSITVAADAESQIIPVSNIPAGTYFVRIQNGEEILSRMFIKI